MPELIPPEGMDERRPRRLAPLSPEAQVMLSGQFARLAVKLRSPGLAGAAERLRDEATPAPAPLSKTPRS